MEQNKAEEVPKWYLEPATWPPEGHNGHLLFDIQYPGYGLNYPSGAGNLKGTIWVKGAAMPVGLSPFSRELPLSWKGSKGFADILALVVNLGPVLREPGGVWAHPFRDKNPMNFEEPAANLAEEPVIGLPLYGRWYAGQHKLNRNLALEPEKMDWFHELNMEPWLRAVAGLAAKVVRFHHGSGKDDAAESGRKKLAKDNRAAFNRLLFRALKEAHFPDHALSEAMPERLAALPERSSLPADSPLRSGPFNLMRPDLLLPGYQAAQKGKLWLLTENRKFIEAWLVGYNEAMMRQLAWRGQPVNFNETPCRSYSHGEYKAQPDIDPIHLWKAPLGENGPEKARILLASTCETELGGRLKLVSGSGTRFEKAPFFMAKAGEVELWGLDISLSDALEHACSLHVAPPADSAGGDTAFQTISLARFLPHELLKRMEGSR